MTNQEVVSLEATTQDLLKKTTSQELRVNKLCEINNELNRKMKRLETLLICNLVVFCSGVSILLIGWLV